MPHTCQFLEYDHHLLTRTKLACICSVSISAIAGCATETPTTPASAVPEYECPDTTVTDAPAAITEFVAANSDFGCFLPKANAVRNPQDRWFKVRNFYVRNGAGRLKETLDVACGRAELPYPVGTIIQLIPFEAMAKRGGEYSPQTAGWEFFFLELNDSAGKTTATIAIRGGHDMENPLGHNCASCHGLASDQDFVCETAHGCDDIPLIGDSFPEMQKDDPRCR